MPSVLGTMLFVEERVDKKGVSQGPVRYVASMGDMTIHKIKNKNRDKNTVVIGISNHQSPIPPVKNSL